jgi:CRISPR/Cas system-associated exonuclease Cas4 (RecB family)
MKNATITHLSVSALQEFIACPRRFRLRRIDRVQPSHRAVALAFGTAFHEAVGLAFFQHGSGESVAVEPVHQKFRDSLRHQLGGHDVPVLFDDGEDEGQLVDAGRNMLTAFLGAYRMPDRIHAIEKRFEVELIDAESGEVLPVPFVGSVDAVTETDGHVRLLELKTAARRWDADRLANDPQITGYAIAMRAQGIVDPELQLAVVTKTKRADVQLERLVRTRGDETELVDTALSVYRAVQAGVDHRQRSWACKSCPFASACAP